MHIFLTRLKVLLKSKANLFWAFLFPLLLGTFFQMSFGGLSYSSPVEKIPLYISSESVTEDIFADELFKMLAVIEISEDEPLFIINNSFSEVELSNQLEEETVYGYLVVDGPNEQINFHIKQNGLYETIIKSVTDQYLQTYSIIVSNQTNPDLPNILADLNRDINLIVDEQISTYAGGNSLIIYFYALIAMICMYSSIWGINMIKDIQADQSDLAFRVGVAPTTKSKLVLIYFLAALLIALLGNLLLLVYLKYLLGVDLGQMSLVVLVVVIGTITGMAFGAFFGVAFKGTMQTKENLMSGVVLLLSAMAGLMSVYVKFFITSNLPFLGYINPANLITEALYSLYYYSDLANYYFSVILLSVLTVIMIIFVIFKMRREKYDSI